MEKCGETTSQRNSGLELFRVAFWLPMALLIYVLSIGPAVRLGGNNSEVGILIYRPVGWACHQSRSFDRFVTKWIRLWDRPPFRRSWRDTLRAKRPGADAGKGVCLHIGAQWPDAAEVEC